MILTFLILLESHFHVTPNFFLLYALETLENSYVLTKKRNMESIDEKLGGRLRNWVIVKNKGYTRSSHRACCLRSKLIAAKRKTKFTLLVPCVCLSQCLLPSRRMQIFPPEIFQSGSTFAKMESLKLTT